MKKEKSSGIRSFFESQQAAGVVLICCTIISLILANSPLATSYKHFWETPLSINIGGWGIEHHLLEWINDGLMAIFFLFVGLEIKRELISGELSNLKVAILPVLVALGGMLVPALFYVLANLNGGNLKGFGIPMATDIAFALGALSLLGNKVPNTLRVFLMALAVIDDLGAIVVIALFYGGNFDLHYFIFSVLTFGVLLCFNWLKVKSLMVYCIAGILLWYFMMHSGVHATIAGVLLALAIPSDVKYTSKHTMTTWLEDHLHNPINYVIMPLFAVANTAITIKLQEIGNMNYAVTLGIFLGLFLGKVIGIYGTTYMAIKMKISEMPRGVTWSDVVGVGFLGGIGFTMSIFVTNLAFTSNISLVDNSKLVIILASTLSGLTGFLILKFLSKKL